VSSTFRVVGPANGGNQTTQHHISDDRSQHLPFKNRGFSSPPPSPGGHILTQGNGICTEKVWC
jgi:hypothetical protein